MLLRKRYMAAAGVLGFRTQVLHDHESIKIQGLQENYIYEHASKIWVLKLKNVFFFSFGYFFN